MRRDPRFQVVIPEDIGHPEWMAKAEEDRRAAELLLRAGLFQPMAFHAQQCAEKALKGVQIKLRGSHDRSHDLVRLARSVAAPGHIVELVATLSAYYTTARYPEAVVGLSEEFAEELLTTTTEVLAWARQATS